VWWWWRWLQCSIDVDVNADTPTNADAHSNIYVARQGHEYQLRWSGAIGVDID
jgi:hypothetical protein